MRRHTLMIDADDTLWENNVFFEKLIEDFITLTEPCGYARAYIRHILNETEAIWLRGSQFWTIARGNVPETGRPDGQTRNAGGNSSPGD